MSKWVLGTERQYFLGDGVSTAIIFFEQNNNIVYSRWRCVSILRIVNKSREDTVFFLPSYSPANTYFPTCIIGFSLAISLEHKYELRWVRSTVKQITFMLIATSETHENLAWTAALGHKVTVDNSRELHHHKLLLETHIKILNLLLNGYIVRT